MGFRDKLKSRRQSKNIEDLRDPKKLARYNAKVQLEEYARSNFKLKDKTPIAKQEDVETDLVNYVGNNLKKERQKKISNLTKKKLNPSDPPAQSGFNYNSQVTPGKFEMKDNRKK